MNPLEENYLILVWICNFAYFQRTVSNFIVVETECQARLFGFLDYTRQLEASPPSTDFLGEGEAKPLDDINFL